MGRFQKIDILMPVGEKGGVENVVSKTAVYLMDRGYQVRIVQLVWEQTRWLPETVEFHPLFEGRGSYSMDQFVEKYQEFLQTHGTPDLILATTWPALVLIAKLTLLSMQAHVKIIAWLHGPLEQYVQAGYGGMECLEKADSVFVLNRRTEEMLLRNPNCGRVSIVRNPTDFSSCPIQKTTSSKNQCLLFVGRISKEKRLDLIIRALDQAETTWTLRIIGDGEERETIENMVQELGLEKQVAFYGWKKNPWKHAGKVTATILSSAYECFPMAAVESLACGIPVIAPPVDGISELIQPGINGFVYSQGSSEELAHILDKIATGKFPEISSEQCRNSVTDFEASKALTDFENKMTDILDKISVIIPCHNVQNRIEKCLDSIFEQKLRNANLEVICVDDKSTDNTIPILKEYERKYSDIMLLVLLEENSGQGHARNIGMQYASGNYISFVDAGDLTAPMMLQALYQQILDTQSDVAECAYKQMQWKDQPLVEEIGNPEYYNMHDITQKRDYLLKYGCETDPWGRLYRREFLEKYQIDFPPNTKMEHIYFSELCMMHMKSCARLPRTYYFHCENAAGTMYSENIIHYYMDMATVQIAATERLMRENCLSECQDEYAYLHFSKAFAEPIGRMIQDQRFYSYENFNFLKDSLFRLFPNIIENPYISNEQSQIMEIYRTLLERDWTEPDLRKAIADHTFS